MLFFKDSSYYTSEGKKSVDKEMFQNGAKSSILMNWNTERKCYMKIARRNI